MIKQKAVRGDNAFENSATSLNEIECGGLSLQNRPTYCFYAQGVPRRSRFLLQPCLGEFDFGIGRRSGPLGARER